MSFVGNVQTALFYPPMWLTFLAGIGGDHLPYSNLEILILAHVWVAFLLSFLWLRGKRLDQLACALGAGIFAYSGYMLLQLQHLGLIGGYTWFPLGLWGIDQAIGSGSWRPLWKVAVASALCLLAGYPPTFVVFCVCMLTYAVLGSLRWKAVFWTGTAILFSLLLTMVQLLPAREVLMQKVVTVQYGSGVYRPGFFLSYFIPNYFDFALTTPVTANPGGEYLYLGAPAFFGLVWLIFGRRSMRGQWPVLGVGVVCFLLATNPFHLVWNAIRHSDLLIQIVRAWYFLAGLTLSASALAAAGIDDFLRRGSRPISRWGVPLAIGLLATWSARQLRLWFPGGSGFAAGWASVVDPIVMLTLFMGSMLVLRAEKGRWRVWMTIAVLAAVGVDYKVFGTSKRVNATKFDMEGFVASGQFPGMSDEAFRELHSHPEYRVAFEDLGFRTADLRYRGLTTPQGDDPLAPAQYFDEVILPAHPVQPTRWTFLVDPANHALLELLGVRYVVTAEGQPFLAQLKGSSDFRPVGTLDSYFKVFEFTKAVPGYRWGGQVRTISWRAGKGDFSVDSATGGQFIFIEQFLPGWRAAVDGRSVPIERWNHAFQSIQVPPGNHTVAFSYCSTGLRVGAVISLAALLALAALTVVPRAPSMAQ